MSQIPPQMPPLQQPQAYGSPAQAQPQKTNGLAIASVVCACLTIIPMAGLVAGIAAIVMGAFAISRCRSKAMAITGLVGGVVGLLVLQSIGLGLSFWALGNAREMARLSVCRSNMHSLGMGLALYQSDYNNAMPPDLGTAKASGNLTNIPDCPTAQNNRSGNGSFSDDYFYSRPQDFRNAARPGPGKMLVACELHKNHERRVVLYEDFRAEIVDEAQFQAELNEPLNSKFAEAFRAAGGS